MASVGIRRGERVQGGLLLGLLALSALAWLSTRERMLGMDAGPGTAPGGLGFYVVSWVVMMAAMMFPSVAPMALAFAFVQRRRRERGALQSTVSQYVFLAGYLITWAAFGLLAYGVYEAGRSTSPHWLAFSRGGRYLAGGVLVAAAVYQLTPAKDRCLSHCRGTLDFILGHWHEGRLGALRMGAEHGAWCVGCCWALMASLFALGVMSLTWMIAISVLIALEKLLPSKLFANRLVATTLLVLGLGVAFAPDRMPGLTIPGSPAAVRAMRTMHMGTGMPMHQAKHKLGTMPMSGAGHGSGAMSSGGSGDGATAKSGGKSGAMP